MDVLGQTEAPLGPPQQLEGDAKRAVSLMTPAPTPQAHFTPIIPSPGGQVLCQSCLQGPLSASVRPPTLGCLSG